MSGEAAYLAGIPPDRARRLAEVNAAGLDALRRYLASGEAVAFLGAGASAPLYPLWTEVISQLIDAAVARRLAKEAAGTCRAVAGEQPYAVAELLRRHLGPAQYAAALREVFRVRRDPGTGRTWTPTQELVCRCTFKAVVTGGHLYSIWGTQWGEFLASTGRVVPGWILTDRNLHLSSLCDWRADVARCDRLLARLDLILPDTNAAGPRLVNAVITFRDGDYLVELAATLPLLAECLRIGGDLDGAERSSTEAIAIVAPRQLRLSHTAGLAVRARTYADRAAKGDRQHLERGRDAADAALRIATRHRLPWHELDAMGAHAHLDEVEGTDHGWAAKAAKLHERLVPEGLDPDPLATVERRVAEEKAQRTDTAGGPTGP